MPHYAVRITHSYEVAKPIVHLWAMKCEKILAYEHLGERTGKIHIHLLLVNTSVDKKAIEKHCCYHENLSIRQRMDVVQSRRLGADIYHIYE